MGFIAKKSIIDFILQLYTLFSNLIALQRTDLSEFKASHFAYGNRSQINETFTAT